MTHKKDMLLEKIGAHLDDLEVRNPNKARDEEAHLRIDEIRLGNEVAQSKGFRMMERRP